MLDEVEPVVRFRLRIVTVEGTETEERGEARGGVLTGAGSLERADWTRASRRAIWAVRVRIWVSEFEGGGLWGVARIGALLVDDLDAGVRRALEVVTVRVPRLRFVEEL